MKVGPIYLVIAEKQKQDEASVNLLVFRGLEPFMSCHETMPRAFFGFGAVWRILASFPKGAIFPQAEESLSLHNHLFRRVLAEESLDPGWFNQGGKEHHHWL